MFPITNGGTIMFCKGIAGACAAGAGAGAGALGAGANVVNVR